MNEHVIFLDIDGVLNNYRFLEKNLGLKPEEQVFIDDEKVGILKRIVEAAEATIILSSSWRRDFDDDMKPVTQEARIVIDALGRFGLTLSGKTDDSIGKAASIRQWLSDHENVIKNYVILDDDFLDVPGSHFMKTSFYLGLTDEIADNAIARLVSV